MIPASHLARHLRHCHRDALEPHLAVADSKLWFLALTTLIRQGALAEAAFAARRLTSAFPGSIYLAHSAMLLDTMPPAVSDPLYSSFVDQSERSVQVVRRTGATSVLLAFCGVNGALGMPLPIAHRWFGLLRMHVVYLRDMPGGVFEGGLPSLGNDRPATERALERAFESLPATELFCYGNSTGGYGALLYGAELGASAVLALNPFITPSKKLTSRLGERAATDLQNVDLRLLYAGAGSTPRVRIVFGANCPDDQLSASVFADVPGAIIEPVAGSFQHDAHVMLIRRGLFGPLLRDALSPCAGAAAGGSRG